MPTFIEQEKQRLIPFLQTSPYFSEAAQAILRYAFEQLHLSRLICLVDQENRASINVAMKIGMTFEKEGEDELGPFLVYSTSKKH